MHDPEIGIAPLRLSFAELTDEVQVYEYAVLVTSLDAEILALAQYYRDRADCGNAFDELKNHWGWGEVVAFGASRTGSSRPHCSGHFLRGRRSARGGQC